MEHNFVTRRGSPSLCVILSPNRSSSLVQSFSLLIVLLLFYGLTSCSPARATCARNSLRKGRFILPFPPLPVLSPTIDLCFLSLSYVIALPLSLSLYFIFSLSLTTEISVVRRGSLPLFSLLYFFPSPLLSPPFISPIFHFFCFHSSHTSRASLHSLSHICTPRHRQRE